MVSRAEESARLLLTCLERQHSAGIDWQVLAEMEPALAKLVPLQRKVITRFRDGLYLRDAIRVFDPEKAQDLLAAIDYPEFLQDLSNLGYAETSGKFIAKAVRYAEAQQFYAYYA